MKLLAYGAIAAGGIGLANRYAASASAAPSWAKFTGTFDPAALVGLTTTENFMDLGSLLDAALVAWGAWYLMSS